MRLTQTLSAPPSRSNRRPVEAAQGWGYAGTRTLMLVRWPVLARIGVAT